ncbi:GGDEF domain-containing protein [Aliivibrio wodanis]|uniref:GGDEF domain-containing protein n=1 Tax=Aliivibrio wodanis TaxID=80852 RepID=UPI00406C76CE
MERNNKRPIIVTVILSLCLAACVALYEEIGFESYSDLIFEGLTLILLVYISLTAYRFFKSYSFLMIGVSLLIFNKGYDLLTEFPIIEKHADHCEVIDTILDDGSLFAAFFCIAIGITRMVQDLAKQSMKDELTALYTRKKLPQVKLDMFDLIYFDLNDLKKVNDLKGHQVGDLMIIRFSQVLRKACLDREMAFRIGGDEFVVTTHKNRATDFINDIYKQLANEPITFAYGVESTSKDDIEHALIRADKHMYDMKQKQKKKKSTSSAQILYR